jgi:branched-subunit amino acid aminotransferase/4-amino-4-deoxychorismate lyase
MAFHHVIVNGQIVPASEAKISLLNAVLLNGFGVYESIEVIRGVPFHLDDHLARLADSAGMIEMELPHTTPEIAEWIRCLTLHVERDCILRVVALGVVGEGDEELVAVLPQPLPRYPEQYYRQGVRVVTYAGCRHLPACKSLNTLVNFLARRHALQVGAQEAVLCSDGRLTEGARSNIFAVHKGELWTPPAGQVLSGITRDIVLRLAMEAGIVVHERNLYLAEVAEYDEFFITSTSMHVMPIVAIDDLEVGRGRVGDVTNALLRQFEAYHRRCCESPTPPAACIPASHQHHQHIVS